MCVFSYFRICECRLNVCLSIILSLHLRRSPPSHALFNRLLDVVQIVSFYCQCILQIYFMHLLSSTINDCFVAKCTVFNSIHYIERCNALNQHITPVRFEIETKPSSNRLNAYGNGRYACEVILPFGHAKWVNLFCCSLIQLPLNETQKK